MYAIIRTSVHVVARVSVSLEEADHDLQEVGGVERQVLHQHPQVLHQLPHHHHTLCGHTHTHTHTQGTRVFQNRDVRSFHYLQFAREKIFVPILCTLIAMKFPYTIMLFSCLSSFEAEGHLGDLK